jgi:hypothetical protein
VFVPDQNDVKKQTRRVADERASMEEWKNEWAGEWTGQTAGRIEQKERKH